MPEWERWIRGASSYWPLDGSFVEKGWAQCGLCDDALFSSPILKTLCPAHYISRYKGSVFMHPILRGEIYYAALHDVMGSEQAGQRPVLVLQNDQLNQKSPTTIVVPITSVLKHPFMQSHFILLPGHPLRERSMVLTEQIRALDRQRLGSYIGRLNEKELRCVEQSLCFSLDLNL